MITGAAVVTRTDRERRDVFTSEQGEGWPVWWAVRYIVAYMEGHCC